MEREEKKIRNGGGIWFSDHYLDPCHAVTVLFVQAEETNFMLTLIGRGWSTKEQRHSSPPNRSDVTWIPAGSSHLKFFIWNHLIDVESLYFELY
jgi:hypothetical protein